jgi:acyl carrier protein
LRHKPNPSLRGFSKISHAPAIRAFTNQSERSRRHLRFCARAPYHAPGRFSEKANQSMSMKLRIMSAMKQIAEEQHVTLPPLDDNLSLHETGFDSLGFAILVARLEDDLGVDPFTIAEDAAFPLTVSDFIRACENVPA